MGVDVLCDVRGEGRERGEEGAEAVPQGGLRGAAGGAVGGVRVPTGGLYIDTSLVNSTDMYMQEGTFLESDDLRSTTRRRESPRFQPSKNASHIV